MEIVKVILIVIEAICSLLLIGIILLQRSKSEGLGMAFGSGMGETLFGSRTGNVLTKITITLATVFVLTTTLLAMVFSNYHEKSIIDQRTPPLSAQPISSPQPMDSGMAPTAPVAPSGPANTLLPGSSLEEQPVQQTTPVAPITPEPVTTEAPAQEPAP